MRTGAMHGVQACVRKTHSASASMHRATWTGVAERAAGQATVTVPQAAIVPTVATAAEPGAFPGLYPAGLSATMIPARPWLGVLHHTLCGSAPQFQLALSHG